jgi:hypothetical protein
MFVVRHFMSDTAKWEMFVRNGRKNPAYLRPGDRISASIRTDDGAIDLGEQTTVITAGDQALFARHPDVAAGAHCPGGS